MKVPASTDYGLYFAIGALTVWQGFHFAMTTEAVLSALLGGLVALKAKRSGRASKKRNESTGASTHGPPGATIRAKD